VFFALFGSIFFLTQYLQFVLGYSALAAGLRIAPVAVAIAVAAPISAILTKRLGTKAVVTLGLGLVAAALLLLSTAHTGSGYGLVLATILLMGMGMGLAMTPATDSIMGSVPKEKAGVGSAVNDTTREIGGALGVAILGSIAAASYHGSVSTASLTASGLPADAASAAHDSIGGAVSEAGRLGAAGQDLAARASNAFVDAMGTTLKVAAAVAVLGALVALIWLPARAIEADADELGELDEIALAELAAGEDLAPSPQ
jgi:Na+/melibiose symporter-like transporter